MLNISRIKVLLLKLVKATIFINNKVMTQEDRNLLLKDLCARLPYGVKVQVFNYGIEAVETLYEIDLDGYISTIEGDTLKYSYKPYLFPLSSMTEEQKKEFKEISKCEYAIRSCGGFDSEGVYLIEVGKYEYEYGIDTVVEEFYFNREIIDWFNENHFDYCGLISIGLAIDATNLNIY
jgi:hypothetical protein